MVGDVGCILSFFTLTCLFRLTSVSPTDEIESQEVILERNVMQNRFPAARSKEEQLVL